MTFNIRRGTARDGRNRWVYRRTLVKEVFNKYHPDVVGLQEALDFQVSEIRAMLPGYGYAGMGTLVGAKGFHNAIFYDASLFTLSDEDTFWLSDTPDIPGSNGWGNKIPRLCTWVRLVERQSQLGFYFYNTHLDHISRRSRKMSVALLMDRIHGRPSPDPFVLVGDFNSRERSVPIRYLEGRTPVAINPQMKRRNPTPLIDAFRAQHPGKRHSATFHGYHRYLFRFRLDYIFVSISARVMDAEIIHLQRNRRYPSDHFPLFARIDLPAPSASLEARSPYEKAIN